MDAGARDEVALWGKYVDWCSARVAGRLLALPPAEAYERAAGVEEVGVEPEERGPVGPAGVELEDPRSTPVRRLLDRIVDDLHLPSFEEWAAAYGESPARFEAEILGFWQRSQGATESAAATGVGSVAPADPV